MDGYQLKEIFLGEPDGKKEALYKSDFEKYFYNFNNVIEEALNPKNFLILGRKGSGKTILAEYLKKITQGPLNFSEVRSYKEFKFQELVHFKTADIRPNEYIPFWEWVILLDIARLSLQDNGILNNEYAGRLNKFYKENYVSINIDSKKILEITKENKISANALNIGAEAGIQSKQSSGSYLHYLEDLRDVVLNLLKTSNSKYMVFYDELDDRFQDEDHYKDGVISLIKAADKLNLLFLENGVNTKIIVLLRSDIFSLLNDPDLNKIKMGNSIILDWGNTADSESPIFDLILNKIRISISSLQDKPREELFSMFFPQYVGTIHPARFLLERTFFRPRDAISYLNLIIKKYPSTKYFGSQAFTKLKSSYSEYFFQEIRNELCGHLSNIEIDQGTLLLKQFNKHRFTYDEITKYFCENHPNYRHLDLDKILKVFFKFSIIGNVWLNEQRRIDFYSFSYRDNHTILDLQKDMLIHLGLREELSL